MSTVPSDYISFTALLPNLHRDVLCVVNDTEEASTSLFSILEREVYPHFLSRLSDNTNDWVIKKAAEFQEIDPLFCPLTYTNSEVKFNTLFFPTDASRYAYFIGVMQGDIRDDWYKVRFSTNALHKTKDLDLNLSFFCPSYYTGTLSNISEVSLWMYPIEIIPIKNEVLEDEYLNIVLFVDWRYFIRNEYYDTSNLFSGDNGVFNHVSNPIVRVINSIISNIRKNRFPDEFFSDEISSLSFDSTVSTFKYMTIEDVEELDPEIVSDVGFRLRSLEGCPLPLAIDTILAFYGMKLYCREKNKNNKFYSPYRVEISTPILTHGTKLKYDPSLSRPNLEGGPSPIVRTYWPVATAQDNANPTAAEITTIIDVLLNMRVNRLLSLPTEVRMCFNSIPEVQGGGAAYGLFSDTLESRRSLDGYYFHSCLRCFGYGEKREHTYLVCERTELNKNKWLYHGAYVEHKEERGGDFGCPSGWSLTQTDVTLLNTVELNNGNVGRMGNGTFVGGEPSTGLDIETADNYGSYITYDRDELLPVGAGGIYKIYEHGGYSYFAAENAILNKAGIRRGTLVRAYDGVGYPKVYSDGVTYRLEPFTTESAIEAGTEILFARDADTQMLRAITAAAVSGGTVCYFDNDTSLHRTYDSEDTGDYPPTDSEGGTSSGGSGNSSSSGSSSSGDSGSESSGSSGGESTSSDSGGDSSTQGGESSGEGTSESSGESSGDDSGGDGGSDSGDDNGDDPFTNDDDPGLPTDFTDDGANP